MGWPRKNEVARLYREPDGAYLVVFPGQRDGRGFMDAIGNAFAGRGPTLASTQVEPAYLQWKPRVQWDELPDNWQRAVRYWFDRETEKPESIRGFWRIGQQPKP